MRFIEYMDVGGATRWSRSAVVSRSEMLRDSAAHYGPVVPVLGRGSAPADRFALPDGTTFGIIASTTEPFCAAVRPEPTDRGRRVADVPVRARGHGSATSAARGRDARGSCAADRGPCGRNAPIAAPRSGWRSGAARPLIPLAALKKDAHLEMHTRGG